MAKTKITALALVPLILAGCASSSGPTGSEIMNGSLKPNLARLVIYRSSSFGLALQPDVVVDGKRVAKSEAQGFIACTLPPGRHQVQIDNAVKGQHFGSGTEGATVDLLAGSTTYVRSEPKFGVLMGEIILHPMAEKQGRDEVASLHRTTASCGA